MKWEFRPVSCLNPVTFALAILCWLAIFGFFNLVCGQGLVKPDTQDADTLQHWNKLFSQEGTFLIIGDTCFWDDDSIYWHVDYFMSTGDPNNVWKWSEKWSRRKEDGISLPKGKGNNPLRL